MITKSNIYVLPDTKIHDPHTSMENIISDSMDVKNMINELKLYRQKEIVYLLLDGYCGVEIQKILRMSLQSYTNRILHQHCLKNVLGKFLCIRMEKKFSDKMKI